jgi:hypothetical protein
VRVPRASGVTGSSFAIVGAEQTPGFEVVLEAPVVNSSGLGPFLRFVLFPFWAKEAPSRLAVVLGVP